MGAPQDSQIRRADAGVVDREHNLARTSCGSGMLFHCEVFGTVVDRSDHCVTCRTGMAPSKTSAMYTLRSSWKDLVAARTPATAQRPSSPPTLGCDPLRMQDRKCFISRTYAEPKRSGHER